MHESAVISNLGASGFTAAMATTSVALLLKSRRANGVPGSGAAGDPAGIDVENLTGCAEPGEGGGIGAGHPDLRAELRQLIEQRQPPGGIEMRDHFVEQQ